MEVEYQEEYIRNSRGVQLFTCRWLPLTSPKALVFLCHGYGMECGDFMKGLTHVQIIKFPMYMSEYIRNSRGVQLFTCRWLPLTSPKALVFLCHGYGMECGDFMKGCGTRLASDGYAVFGIDYEGHGRSMGARCYIKKFDDIVSDCCNYFKRISGKAEYMNKKRFLYGESMGGAVALLVHRKEPDFWHGAVLVAPMCKISEKVKPHPMVVSILTRAEYVIPRWKIVPTKDVIDAAFKDPLKREEIRGNKLIYQEKPRLKTALELLRTSMSLEDTLTEVTLPFFVLHGEADTVTDPEVSKALYNQASSKDKTIKLYPGMWHGLTAGETDDNIDIVFRDIISWLDKRSSDQPTSSVSIVVKGDASSSPDPSLNRGQKNYLRGWKAPKMHSAM
ncbi:alpha/beta-Hydrolases superfamily protein [Artemisia annua]|uniref:Alpha/beta-Hydrolases superfamily protein n=1 Tax=Artemisia annua TaxID=35608 RepID=A0A2U1PEE3_ARTAN|nr:alpha/beta-Hydrolases superfamily protein [Artemisia annua]